MCTYRKEYDFSRYEISYNNDDDDFVVTFEDGQKERVNACLCGNKHDIIKYAIAHRWFREGRPKKIGHCHVKGVLE